MCICHNINKNSICNNIICMYNNNNGIIIMTYVMKIIIYGSISCMRRHVWHVAAAYVIICITICIMACENNGYVIMYGNMYMACIFEHNNNEKQYPA